MNLYASGLRVYTMPVICNCFALRLLRCACCGSATGTGPSFFTLLSIECKMIVRHRHLILRTIGDRVQNDRALDRGVMTVQHLQHLQHLQGLSHMSHLQHL